MNTAELTAAVESLEKFAFWELRRSRSGGETVYVCYAANDVMGIPSEESRGRTALEAVRAALAAAKSAGEAERASLVDAGGGMTALPGNPSVFCDECRSSHPDTTPCVSGKVKAMLPLKAR